VVDGGIQKEQDAQHQMDEPDRKQYEDYRRPLVATGSVRIGWLAEMVDHEADDAELR
jgi:hypothetical protein